MKKAFSIVFVIVTTSVLATLVVFMYKFYLTQTGSITRQLQVVQARALAQAGIEKAIHQLSYDTNYAGETNLTLANLPGSFDITISPIDAQKKLITSQSYFPSKQDPKVSRKIVEQVQTDQDTNGNVFSFAIQTGAGGFISDNNATINGSIYSNKDIEIDGEGAKVTGDASAVGVVDLEKQSIVQGSIHAGVPSVSLPQVDIAGWQNKASASGTTYSGNLNLTSNTTLGGAGHISVITGQLLVDANITVTLAGPVWVQGGVNNISVLISKNPNFVIDANLTDTKTVLLANQKISITGNATFTSNKTNAWTLFISNYSDPNNEFATAIDINSNPKFTSAIVYAYNGTLQISSNSSASSARAFIAKKIHITGNTTIDYLSGLATVSFDQSSGSPQGGGFSVIPGTYNET